MDTSEYEIKEPTLQVKEALIEAIYSDTLVEAQDWEENTGLQDALRNKIVLSDDDLETQRTMARFLKMKVNEDWTLSIFYTRSSCRSRRSPPPLIPAFFEETFLRVYVSRMITCKAYLGIYPEKYHKLLDLLDDQELDQSICLQIAEEIHQNLETTIKGIDPKENIRVPSYYKELILMSLIKVGFAVTRTRDCDKLLVAIHDMVQDDKTKKPDYYQDLYRSLFPQGLDYPAFRPPWRI